MNLNQLLNLSNKADEAFATKLQPMYFSKLTHTWKACERWELLHYLKYGYRIKYKPDCVTPAYMLFG